MSARVRVLALIQQRQMTTDEISKELKITRSTIVNALNELKKDKMACIARYQYTGVKPAAYWGVGNVDAPRPSAQTKEQRSARKREERRRRLEREKQLAAVQEFKPRCDIAASWIPRM